VITTFASRVEPITGDLLGLAKNDALAATIFLGHPIKHLSKLKRSKVETFTTLNRFDGPSFPSEPSNDRL
jgi:hypothetical protein